MKRALDSGLPAVVDVVIDQNTLAAIAYKHQRVGVALALRIFRVRAACVILTTRLLA